MVELDSTGTSEDEDVMISPDNKNELLLGASEVDTLVVDCSITASGERSDVAFSIKLLRLFIEPSIVAISASVEN